MVKESWGKKHICPFCNSLFYDMKQPILSCPKCKKDLTEADELEFIQKKTLVKIPPKDEEVETLKIDEEEARLGEDEMFLEDVAKKPLKNYDDSDEEEYDY